MIVEPLAPPFAREAYTLSLQESSQVTEVYGFAGRSGRIYLDGHWLRPATGSSDTILLFMHPATSLSLLPLPAALVGAGFHVMCANSRYLRNDTPLILEKVLLDMGAHILYAREQLGYDKVVLVGWSGGGSLSTFYQAQVERPTIVDTPSGEPLDLGSAKLPSADALLSIAAHLSRAETLTEWLDPSVTDESRPDDRGRRFDIYAANPAHAPPFSTTFLADFRAEQIARNRRITAWVEERLETLRKRGGAENERGFVVHRTMCDPRWIDAAVDPNGRRPDWCYLGDPRAANVGPAGLARYTTLRAWLSQWSLDRTRGRTADNAPSISVPALVIENGADDATPASHPKQIYELLGSEDKRYELIPEATHYYQEQPELQSQVVSLCRGWLNERGLAL